MKEPSQQMFTQARYLNSPWLSRNPGEWEFLKAHGVRQTTKKGEVVTHADCADILYYIEKGRVRTSVFNDDGKEKIILIVEEGNLINVIPVVDNLPHYLVVTALTDCSLYQIKRSVFLRMVENDRGISMKLIHDITRKLRVMITHVEDMTFMTSGARIAKCLYQLAQDYGQPMTDGIRLDIRFTHYEMAIFAGTCRVTASNTLEALIKEGVLRKVSGYYIVTNMNGLKKYIENE